MILIFQIIFYFFLYSFLGWICESIYCSLGNKKVINRGFLNGPMCPVYGFGSLLVIFFLDDFMNNLLLLFIFGVIVTSILEYLTGYLLEVLFHTKWWDYSNKKLNIKGRICIKNSILFGFMSLFLMEVIHKNIRVLVGYLPNLLLISLVIIMITLFLVDLSFTLVSINKLNSKLKWINELKTEEDLKEKLHLLKSKSILQKRILRAYPNMKHKHYQIQLLHFKELIQTKKHNK